MSVLQDLPILSIAVRPLPLDAEAFELESDDVLERMKSALSGGQTMVLQRSRSGVPELRATIRLAHIRGPSHLYAVELELVEMVKPVRPLTSLETLPATTWQRTTLGIANSPESVLDAVTALAARFAEELASETG